VVKLLITVWFPDEVEDAVAGGADVVDVKDPSVGSLGLPNLGVVAEVVERVRGVREVSVAIGDVRCPGRYLEYVAYAVARLGVSYVKVGLEVPSVDLGTEVVTQVVEGLRYCSEKPKLVIVGYADYVRVNSLPPMKVLEVAYKVSADGIMVDTRIKDGTTTFDYLTSEYLKCLVAKAKDYGLFTAVAGSLKKEHIHRCVELGFDVIGFRSAACERGRLGRVSRKLVEELKSEVLRYAK